MNLGKAYNISVIQKKDFIYNLVYKNINFNSFDTKKHLQEKFTHSDKKTFDFKLKNFILKNSGLLVDENFALRINYFQYKDIVFFDIIEKK